MIKQLINVLLLAFLIGVFHGEAVHGKPLQVVTLEQPPIVFTENDEIKGIATDVLNEIFRRLQIPAQIRSYPFARSLYMMEVGSADMLFAVVKTTERQMYMDYPNEILIEQKASLFVRSDSEINFDGNLVKLRHHTFGVLRGATYGSIWKEAVDSGAIKRIEVVNDYHQNLLKLVSERVDILIAPRFTMLYLIKELDLHNKVKELKPSIQSVPTYFTFSKTTVPLVLKMKIESALAELKEEGRIDDIVASYVGE